MNMQISEHVLHAEQFTQWLNNRGHNAAVHPRGGNFIDGVWVAMDAALDNLLSDLYQEFRNESR